MTSAYDGIQAANKLFSQTWQRGDASGVAALYTEACQFLPNNSEILNGRPAVQALIQGWMDGGIKSIELITAEVDDFDHTAVEVGRFILTDADGETVDDGKFIVIWRREGEVWQLHRDIVNSSLPA
ncbi:MAG: DUF4440 domain-containing protein [Pseudomonadales bacterium]|jgi:uncharacterized protein (TIGR02246 family)|nr:DUF4440 domain-containing protein [Pseudomonadales bacterium]